jgi:hypothetical protein
VALDGTLQPSGHKLMRSLLLALCASSALIASDEAPERRPDAAQLHALIRYVETHYAPHGYDPVYVANFSDDHPVRILVEHRHQEYVRSRRNQDLISLVTPAFCMIMLAVYVYASWAGFGLKRN